MCTGEGVFLSAGEAGKGGVLREGSGGIKEREWKHLGPEQRNLYRESTERVFGSYEPLTN